MWDLDYVEDEYPAWIDALQEEHGDFVRMFVTAITEADDDPWEFEGVDNVVVGKAGDPWSMLYRAYLRVSPELELLIVFAVDRHCFIKDNVAYSGCIRLLEFDELKFLRRQSSIESSALRKLRFLRGEKVHEQND